MASTCFRWWLVIVCCIVLSPTPVHADDALAPPTNAEARQHLVRGNRLYRIREFAKAVDEYKAGVLIQDVPLFLYNLGQCYRQLGNYQEALWYYENFLKRGQPTGELRGYVELFIEEMKAGRDKKAKSQPPPAPPLVLQPSPDLATTPLKPSALPAPGSAELPNPWYRDRIGLGIVASGVVAAGISGALFLSARNLEIDANHEDHDLGRIELRDRVHTRRIAGSITGILASGLVIGGIVKLSLRGSPHPMERPSIGAIVSTDAIMVLGRVPVP